MLFPGGAGDFHDYARYIYDRVVEANDAGDYLPLWGICKGYEYMAVFASESGDPLSDLVSMKKLLPLDFLVEDPILETNMFDSL